MNNDNMKYSEATETKWWHISAEALVLGQLPESFGLLLNFIRFVNILQLLYIFIITSQ